VDVTVIRGDLGDDRGDCIIRSVSFNNNGLSGVEMRQDRGLGKGLFDCAECCGVSGPQTNGVSLRVRQIKGMMMSENPTMNW